MMILSMIKLPVTAELLTEISAVTRSIAPEAKASINHEFWAIFTKRCWPEFRKLLEEVIRRGQPGGLGGVNILRLAFTINFEAPVRLFPPEWEFPNINFTTREIVLEGIIPIIVSLDPQLGSPMN
jgi:hypothetical protein